MLGVFIFGLFQDGVRRSDCVAPNDKVTLDDEQGRYGRRRSQPSLEFSLNICLQVLKETTKLLRVCHDRDGTIKNDELVPVHTMKAYIGTRGMSLVTR
jgi:hypothetical protein